MRNFFDYVLVVMIILVVIVAIIGLCMLGSYLTYGDTGCAFAHCVKVVH